MELKANDNKNLRIEVEGESFNRYAIKTHYVQIGENYIDIIEKYVKPYYQDGDFISISENIISLCQNRVIYKKDVKVSRLAKFLSKFAMSSDAGIGVDSPYKMQVAINLCGRFKVIYAAILAGIGKIFRKKGIFYKIVGQEISGLDGFYGKVFPEQTEFVANASHELRTPLTIIQAKQELLLQEPESKIIDKSEDINLTLKETRRLSKMIKELMALARSDANEYKLNKENVNIDNLILEIVKPYKDFAKLENKTIKLDLKYGKEINADKNKITELIIILLDNAIKYTVENDTITIRTYNKDGKCNIEVIDTGIGISDSGLKRVFDRFYREDKARSRETGGTGLGLSIAHTIVTRHKGTIKALHNEPKGTVFLVRL